MGLFIFCIITIPILFAIIKELRSKNEPNNISSATIDSYFSEKTDNKNLTNYDSESYVLEKETDESFIDKNENTSNNCYTKATHDLYQEDAEQKKLTNASEKFKNGYGKNFHSSEEQYRRFCRAAFYSNDKIISINKKEMSMKIHSSSNSEDVYTVTLTNCECEDFHKRNLPCKHMYKLAIELGIMEIPDELLNNNFNALNNPPVIQANRNNIICKTFLVEGTGIIRKNQKRNKIVAISTEPLILDAEWIHSLPPYTVKEIPEELPTESQIRYARNLGFSFPADADKTDASIFIDRKLNDIPLIQPIVPDGILRYVINKGIFVPKYADKDTVCNLYIMNISTDELVAHFGMKVYSNLKNKAYFVLEDATELERELFFQFANEHMDDKSFMNSLARYSASDILFGSYGNLKKLKAYKIAEEYFNQENPLVANETIIQNKIAYLNEFIDILENLPLNTQHELLSIAKEINFKKQNCNVQLTKQIKELLDSGLIFDVAPKNHKINFGTKNDIQNFLDINNISYNKTDTKDALIKICKEYATEQIEKYFFTTICINITEKYNSHNIYSYLHRKYDNAIYYHIDDMTYQEVALLDTELPNDSITNQLIERGYYTRK